VTAALQSSWKTISAALTFVDDDDDDDDDVRQGDVLSPVVFSILFMLTVL